MSDETEARLRALVDQKAATLDPMYKATLDLFRQWLRVTEMAMDDEGVAPGIIRAVLNRITYGAPYAADANQRIELDRKLVEEAMRRPPNPMVVPRCPSCGILGICADCKRGRR